jgi:hypothetical protein
MKNLMKKIINYYNIDKNYILLIICPIIIIAIYYRFLKLFPMIKDPLEKSFLNIKYLKGWIITHVLFFMLVGYLYPKTLVISMTLGIIWEIIEGIDFDSPWWYGQLIDLNANFLGFIIGYLLQKYTKK